jgi:hypothetical protein
MGAEAYSDYQAADGSSPGAEGSIYRS